MGDCRPWAAFFLGSLLVCGGFERLLLAGAVVAPGETPVFAVLDSPAAPAANESEKRSPRAPGIRPQAVPIPRDQKAFDIVPDRGRWSDSAACASPSKERAPPLV